jgi:molybdopterin-guanine dinucleotide biosynthesis protein B
MAQAGSDVVAVSSPHRAAFILQVSEELFLNQMIPMFSERVDIVLTEGYKQADTVKVHVSSSEADNKVSDIVEFLVTQINQSKSV